MRTTLAFALTLTIVTLVGAFLLPADLWGVSSLGYLPISGVTAVCLFSIAVYVTAVLLARGNWLRPRQAVIVTMIVLGVVAAVFGSNVPLWGDGYLRAWEMSSARAFIFTEPLDSYVHYLFNEHIAQPLNLSQYQTYRILSYVGGVLYFVAVIVFARYAGRGPGERVWLVAMFVLSGIIQLFFGHVESYGLSVPLLTMAVVAAYVETTHGRPLLVTPVLFLLSCLLHMSNLAYFPAFAAAASANWLVHRRRTDAIAVVETALAFAAAAGTVAILLYFEPDHQVEAGFLEFVLLPLTPSGGAYWVLSTTHLVDMVNEYALVAPLALATAPLWVPRIRKDAFSPFSVLCVGMLFCGFLYMLLFNTSFGIGRDWDLYSSVGVPLCALGAVGMARAQRKGVLPRPAIAYVAVVPASLIVAGFVVSNSQEEALVAHYEDIIYRSEHGRGLNLENLSTYHKYSGDTTTYFPLLREAERYQRHPRYRFRMASSYLKLGMTAHAVGALREAVGIDSTYVPALRSLAGLHLVGALNTVASIDSAVQLLERAAQHDSDNVEVLADLAGVYARSGQLGPSSHAYARALAISDDDAALHEGIGIVHIRRGQYDSAEIHLVKSLKLDERRLRSYLSLADIYRLSKRRRKGIALLARALSLFSDVDQKVALAAALERLGQVEQAMRVLEDIVSSRANTIEATIALAGTYQRNGLRSEAANMLSQAWRRARTPEHALHVAQEYVRLGWLDSAATCLQALGETHVSQTPLYRRLNEACAEHPVLSNR